MAPNPAPPRTRRTLRVALLAALALAAAGGYYAFSRQAARSAARKDALAQAEANPTQGLPALLRCLESDPDDPDLLRAAVRLQLAGTATVEEVGPLIDRWAAARPGDPEPYRAKLALLQKYNRGSEAVAPAERVLELAPDDTQTRMQLASLYFTAGRYDDAARECRRLLDAPTANRNEVAVALARAEAARGNLPEAARLLDGVLAADPARPDALLQRGVVHYQAGEYEKAVAVLRRVKYRSPLERTEVLNHLGLALTRAGKPAEAKAAFDELTRVQEADLLLGNAQEHATDVPLQLRAGRALLDTDQPEDARRLLEAAVARNGPNKAALEMIAECYDRLGRPELAREARGLAARLP